jgi:hypothetical protein
LKSCAHKGGREELTSWSARKHALENAEHVKHALEKLTFLLAIANALDILKINF